MKKVTVESWFHNQCSASFLCPDYLETTRDAMIWLESESYREKQIGIYGNARRRERRVINKLCGIKECRCGGSVHNKSIIDEEEFDNE